MVYERSALSSQAISQGDFHAGYTRVVGLRDHAKIAGMMDFLIWPNADCLLLFEVSRCQSSVR